MKNLFTRVIALSVATSCSTAHAGANNLGALQTLDTAELRAVLHNASMRNFDDQNYRGGHPEVEWFREDGIYARRGGRASHSGTFTIRHARVCVQFRVSGPPDCFQLQRDRRGQLWRVSNSNRDRVLILSNSATGPEDQFENRSYGGARVLDTAELRALLHNVSLIRVQDPGVITSHVAIERYLAGGEYLSTGGRVRHEGTFYIEDSSVCLRLRLAGQPDCFRLERDAQGSLWKVDYPNHPPIRVRIQPIE